MNMKRSLPGLKLMPIPQAFISFDGTQWAFTDEPTINRRANDLEQRQAADDLNNAFNKFVNARSDAFNGTAGVLVPQYTRDEIVHAMERYLERNAHVGATKKATRDQLKYALDMVYGND